MTPERFLERWKSERINSGTQQSDVPRLIEDLLTDAENKGISRHLLTMAAGGSLVQFVIGAVRAAIEEEIL